MTSTIVPPVDLAPGMPSRVVTISATDVTEGGKSLEGQMVRFALSDTLDVSSGGDVIAKTQAEVVLDSNGEGRIRLPVYTDAVKTWCGDPDWAILVTATWGSQKAIRVPAGSSSIALSALPPVRPLRGREKLWAITGVSLTVTTNTTAGSASGTAAINGGIIDIGLELPAAGPHTHDDRYYTQGEVEQKFDTDARIPDIAPVDDVLVAITDADGRSTWLEASATDGGPTEWAAQQIRKSARTELADVDETLVAITDADGRSTWLEASATDGGPTEWAAQHIRRVAAGASPTPAVRRGTNRRLWTDGAGGLRRITSDPSVVACWGDSLTAGYPRASVPLEQAWPAVLDSLYGGGTTFNGGVAGLSADEIALRQGGYVTTVDAVTLPASGPVTVVTQSDVWWWHNTWTFPATLAGVPGVFQRSGGTSTFTRDAPGEAVGVPNGTPLLSTIGAQYSDNVQVLFAGRNDVPRDLESSAGDPPDRVIAATVAMVERLTPKHPRFLLVGTTTRVTETVGTLGYSQVATINNTLRDLYPESFYDLRAYLVNDCIHDIGITPTAADVSAMRGDTLPPSIMVPGDQVHYDAPAHEQVGHRIYEQLTTRGWIPA